MSDRMDHAGMAALSICEALPLAMNDYRLLPESEVLGVLRDAAAVHKNVTGPEVEMDAHRAVSGPINRIIAGGNSVRRQ